MKTGEKSSVSYGRVHIPDNTGDIRKNWGLIHQTHGLKVDLSRPARPAKSPVLRTSDVS